MYPFIRIFGRSFSTYALMALLGAILCVVYCFVISLRKKLSFKYNVFFLITGVPLGFIGAVLMYYVSRIDEVSLVLPYLFSDPHYFFASVSYGFVYYGGLLGFLCGLAIGTQISDADNRKTLFYMFPCIPLFHAVGRIGCFFSGCCYGINGFPIQLVESGINIIIFIILCCILNRDKKYFLTSAVYFLTYGTVRFILEYFRGDSIRGKLWIFSTSQWISLLIIIPLGIYNLCVRTEKNHFNKWFKS